MKINKFKYLVVSLLLLLGSSCFCMNKKKLSPRDILKNDVKEYFFLLTCKCFQLSTKFGKKNKRLRSLAIGDCKNCKRYNNKKGIIEKIVCCDEHEDMQDLYDDRRFDDVWDYFVMDQSSIAGKIKHKEENSYLLVIYIAIRHYLRVAKQNEVKDLRTKICESFLSDIREGKTTCKELLGSPYIKSNKIMQSRIKLLEKVLTSLDVNASPNKDTHEILEDGSNDVLRKVIIESIVSIYNNAKEELYKKVEVWKKHLKDNPQDLSPIAKKCAKLVNVKRRYALSEGVFLLEQVPKIRKWLRRSYISDDKELDIFDVEELNEFQKKLLTEEYSCLYGIRFPRIPSPTITFSDDKTSKKIKKLREKRKLDKIKKRVFK